MKNKLRKTLCVIAGVGAFAAAAPAFAQSSEEIIVNGNYGRVPDNVQHLTQAVSYADLDLSTDAGRRELKHRVSLTARFLCNKLGENEMASTGPIPTCREAAVKDAMSRVGTAEQNFAPRGTAWVAPAAWHAPYPATWVQQYPDD